MATLLAIAATGSPVLATSPGQTTVPQSAPSAGSLQPMIVSTQLWVGDNDLIFDLLDADGVRLDDADLMATVRLTGPDGQSRAQYDLAPIQFATKGRVLYRARAALDAPGDWAMTVTARTGDGRILVGEPSFQVLPDDGTPALGQTVVPVDTPTLESSGHDLATITTDPDPVPQLYWSSVRDALTDGRPFMFVIDTVGLGVNSSCGSAIGEAREMRASFPGLLIIHAEPFVTPSGDAVLVKDPTTGPRRIAPWAASWGVTEPPWLFVVAADGTLRAKFQGIFGTDELLSALRAVSPFAPGGH